MTCVNLVEHPARVACGPGIAGHEFRPSLHWNRLHAIRTVLAGLAVVLFLIRAVMPPA